MLDPLPLIAAVSIASAIRATKSERMSCSMSGVDWRLIRWENLLSAPTVLGDIVTVPMVPVDSVTESELSAPNQYAVALPVRLGVSAAKVPEAIGPLAA